MVIWLVVDLPLWKMMELVSWDDYSQYMETLKMFQTTNQIYILYTLFGGKWGPAICKTQIMTNHQLCDIFCDVGTPPMEKYL